MYLHTQYTKNHIQSLLLTCSDTKYYQKHIQKKHSCPRNIKHPKTQHLWWASRYLIYQVYGQDAQIITTSNQKKILRTPSAPPVHLSLSHKDIYAVSISSNYPVGIDIEKISPQAYKLKDKFLSLAEQEYLHTNENNLEYWATLFWAVKETLYKWFSEKKLHFKKEIYIHKIEEGNVHVLIKTPKSQKPLTVSYYIFNHSYIIAYVATPFSSK